MNAIDTVLVAYRSEGVIRGAVEAAGSLGGRVVVVDHGDGASAVRAAAAGAVAVHDPSNPGFGAGQNHGLAFTESEFVLLCNPDAEIVSAAVRSGLHVLAGRPDAAAVQGVIVNQATGRPERSAGVELGPVHLLGRALGAKALLRIPAVARFVGHSSALRDHAERVPLGPVDVESLAATTLLVRRSALDAVDGFDESYFLYGEDLDLCRRLRAAGWKLVAVPDVWATHTSGGSAECSRTREAHWWRGTMQFGAAWWDRRAWGLAVLAASLRWVQLAAAKPRHARPSLEALLLDPLAARRRAARFARHTRLSTERPVRSIYTG
ncbi:MAG: glycosyltransferase [Acidimicrobiales bacterium]